MFGNSLTTDQLLHDNELHQFSFFACQSSKIIFLFALKCFEIEFVYADDLSVETLVEILGSIVIILNPYIWSLGFIV